MKNITITLAVLLLLAPITALAQGQPQCEFEYTVQAGDWLSKIAEKQYGNPLAFEQIVTANNAQADDKYSNIDDPDLIEPGWVLCIPPDNNQTSASPTPPAGLSPEALSNLTYQTQWTLSGTAKLENGFYSEPGPPGAGFATSVRLDEQFTVYGRLNGQDAAAVILVIDLSGTGRLVDLALVLNQNGQPVNVATVNLGNRVKINSVQIENNQVLVDMITQGSEDHPCCPSQQVLRTYKLEGNQLLQSGEQPLGQVILPANLSPDTLANMTYQSSWTQSGLASLVNGEYREPAAPGSATETVTTLETKSFNYGELDGRPSVPVFLRVDPGGSGSFTDLAVVSDVEGQPVNVATVTLGDRVQIIDHRLVENTVEVNLMTHGPDQALSEAPNQQYLRRYAVQNNELVLVNEKFLGNYPGTYQSSLTPDQVTFDANSLAQSVVGKAIPATPYNACCPPGPTGAPDHLVFEFDGQARLYIYPIQEWESQWNAAGNNTISTIANRLRTLLSGETPTPQSGLPVLASGPALASRWAQYARLDFASGQGIRFVADSPNRQDAGPITNETVAYYFQGLTGDGRYYVSFSYPVSTSALPNTFDEVPEATRQRVFDPEQYDDYLQETLTALDGLAPSAWQPDLSRLDGLAQSIKINQ